jgi:hypothetical protein
MTRLSLALAIAAVLAGTQASASDWKGQFATKHQIVAQVVDCMRKRMSNDRRISYNEAAKVCRTEVARRLDDTSSSGALVAADRQGK